MAVVLADILHEQQVTLELQAQTRDEVLRELVGTIPPALVEEPAAFLQAVLEREQMHTTFMGNGVAFPHARTDRVQEIVMAIGRSARGVPFGEQGEPAHLIFLIGVPRRLVKDYLVCVGAVARLAKEQATRDALMAATSATEFIELLRAGSMVLE